MLITVDIGPLVVSATPHTPGDVYVTDNSIDKGNKTHLGNVHCVDFFFKSFSQSISVVLGWRNVALRENFPI